MVLRAWRGAGGVYEQNTRKISRLQRSCIENHTQDRSGDSRDLRQKNEFIDAGAFGATAAYWDRMRNRRVWGSAAWAAALVGVGCHGSPSIEGETTNTVEQEVSSDPVKAAGQPASNKWTKADDNIISTIWLGNDDKGTLYTPLFRGGFPGVEDLVYVPPSGDCSTTKTTLRIDWDRAANTVHLLVKGKGYPVRPDVHRTENVDWWPNQFHNSPKDFTNGAYRLWIVLGSTTRQANYYYDATTLQLKGSDFDFPAGAPAGAIAAKFPIISITGSNEFDPDSSGFAVHQWNAAYDHVTVESGTFARAWATFAPLDLCEAAPLQPNITQLRPVLSPWQAAADAPKWDDMLHAGMGFDVQIDERTSLTDAYGGNLPYIFSGISYAGNMTAIQGGVPSGYSNSILASFQNVAPVIFPVPGGNGRSCHSYVHEPHVTAPRYCEGAH